MNYNINKDKNGYFISLGYIVEFIPEDGKVTLRKFYMYDTIHCITKFFKEKINKLGFKNSVKYIGEMAYFETIEICEDFIDKITSSSDDNSSNNSEVVKTIKK
jgi:hypothetical protein